MGLERVAMGPDYFDYLKYHTISGIETSSIKTMDSLAGLLHLSKCLIAGGLTESQVDKVFRGNAIRFFDGLSCF